VQTRQVLDLPFISRGGMDLLVTQPGVQTGTTNRTSFINGLPLAAMSVTIDGINTQDNYYKNGDGFFTVIPARQDSLEEITVSTSASGVDSNSQGAAQVKFITKGGTNQFHGGSFWQHRNTALNANSYFNNINGLNRNKVILNQGGINIGGPIIKNKLFFFTNYEIYRYPAQTSITRVVATPDAATGNFTYPVGAPRPPSTCCKRRLPPAYLDDRPHHRANPEPDQRVCQERHVAGPEREQLRLESQEPAVPAQRT